MSLTKIVLTFAGGTLLLAGATDVLAQDDDFAPTPKETPEAGAKEKPGKEGEKSGDEGKGAGEEGKKPGDEAKKPVWSTVKTQWGETFDKEDLKTEESKLLMEKLKAQWLGNPDFNKAVDEKTFNLALALQKNAAGAYSALFRFVGEDGTDIIDLQRITDQKQVEVLRSILFPGTLEQVIDPALKELKPYLVEQDGRTLVKFPLSYEEELTVRETKLLGFYRAAFPELYKGKNAPEAVAVDRDLTTKDKDMLKKEVVYDAKEKQFYVVTHLEKGKTRKDKISTNGVLSLIDAIARQSQLQTTYMSKEGIVVNGERHNAEADKKALEAELANVKKLNIDPSTDRGQNYTIDQFKIAIDSITNDKTKQYATNLMNILYGATQDPNLPQHAIAKNAGANLRMRVYAFDKKGKEANMFRIELYNGDKLAMTYLTTVNKSAALGDMNGLEVWEAIKKARNTKK